MDQAEGLCHRITLYFGRLNIETGVLYYCVRIVLKYWTVVCFVSGRYQLMQSKTLNLIGKNGS